MPPLQRRSPSGAGEELEKCSDTLLCPALHFIHQYEWMGSGKVGLRLTEVLEEGRDLRATYMLPFALDVLSPREHVSAGLRIRTALESL